SAAVPGGGGRRGRGRGRAGGRRRRRRAQGRRGRYPDHGPAPAGGTAGSGREPEDVGDRVSREAVAGRQRRTAGGAADAVVGGVEVKVGPAVRDQVGRVPGRGEQLGRPAADGEVDGRVRGHGQSLPRGG